MAQTLHSNTRRCPVSGQILDLTKKCRKRSTGNRELISRIVCRLVFTAPTPCHRVMAATARESDLTHGRLVPPSKRLAISFPNLISSAVQKPSAQLPRKPQTRYLHTTPNAAHRQNRKPNNTSKRRPASRKAMKISGHIKPNVRAAPEPMHHQVNATTELPVPQPSRLNLSSTPNRLHSKWRRSKCATRTTSVFPPSICLEPTSSR